MKIKKDSNKLIDDFFEPIYSLLLKISDDATIISELMDYVKQKEEKEDVEQSK